jgi:GH24 family phage-related lysozyme (muramidase)
MLDHLITLAPWLVVLIIYVGEKIQQYMQARTLNDALERAQTAVHTTIAPAPVPVPPAPPAPPLPVAVPSHVTEPFISFLKKEEGFTPHAYGDYKQYSIGYGTKATGPNEVIDMAEADRRLRSELAAVVKEVDAFVPADTPLGVREALYDLTYNAGSAWMQQNLGKHIKSHDYEAAKQSFLQYTHAGGKVLDALVKRREAGVAMFDHPL